MIFNEQDVFVFSYKDGEPGEIEWFGPWSDEADERAREVKGFAVQVNSDPAVIFANYTDIPTKDLERALTTDHIEHEPEGGYVCWQGDEFGGHIVTLFGTHEGDYDSYEAAVDALIAGCKDLLRHPFYKGTAIECFFACCIKGHEVRIPIGKVR